MTTLTLEQRVEILEEAKKYDDVFGVVWKNWEDALQKFKDDLSKIGGK